jgi:hypothetical protein
MAGTSSTMRLGGWRRTDRRQYHRRENHPVNTRKFHEIWVEHCDATLEIKLRYGSKRRSFTWSILNRRLEFGRCGRLPGLRRTKNA